MQSCPPPRGPTSRTLSRPAPDADAFH